MLNVRSNALPVKGLDARRRMAFGGLMTEQTVPLLIHTQYIKKLEFDSPGAPLSLAPGGPQPKLHVSVGMDGKSYDPIDGMNGKPYEITLSVAAKATVQDSDAVLFDLNLSYGMFVTVSEAVPEDQHHPLLMIEGPKVAFPFMRQIVAEVTQNAGFPQLMLTPVNFDKLYRDQYAQQVAQTA